MTKPPAFQFYAGDWLTGTLGLSLAARGAYITLLAYQWDKGGIPGDDKMVLKRILSCSSRDLKAVMETISIHFDKCDDGLWRNPRLEMVRSEQSAYKEERTRAGRLGAEKRWRVPEPMAEPIAEPLANDWQKDASSSSTPTPTLRREEGTGPPPLLAPRICPPSRKHAWCDGRMHVPLSLHHEFQRLSPDGFDLQTWYGETDLAWAFKPIGDDAFTFWRARWREEFGTTAQTDAEIKRAAQRERNRLSEQSQ